MLEWKEIRYNLGAIFIDVFEFMCDIVSRLYYMLLVW